MRGRARRRAPRAPPRRPHGGNALARRSAHERGGPAGRAPWIEEFPPSASYRMLREGIRDYYRSHLPLTPRARADALLNRGTDGSAACATTEGRGRGAPSDAGALSKLAGRLLGAPPIPARPSTHGWRPRRGGRGTRLETGADHVLEARFFLDATRMATCWNWPESSTCSARSRAPRPGNRTLRTTPACSTSKRSRLLRLVECTSPARTIRSTNRGSTSAGATYTRGWPGPLLGWTT